MSSQNKSVQHCWTAVGAILLLGACSGPEEALEDDSAEKLETVQQELNSTDTASVNKLKSDMQHYKPRFKVKPIIECIDKISSSKFIAHFGYSNSESSTRTIDVGGLNRFFPNPQGRGQPTVFSKGTWKNQVQVPFNGQLLVWAVDGNVAIAHQWITVCPKPPVKCPVSCDDKNPCTADLCNASTGFKCVHRAQANGVSCADGNACNGEEVCRDGKCKAGTPPVCQDSNSCTANTCDPKQGCLVVPKKDGTSCPVSGNCGAGGTCKTGVCQAKAPSCDDKNPCTADACGPNNTCKHTLMPVGTSCGDSNFCNGAEACNSKGQCRATTRPDCNDGNPCTVDSCVSSGGCGHVPGHDGKKCKTASGSSGKCDTGVCQPTGVVCADDGNACTDEVIDPITGACTHPPKVDDTPCNDNNLCTRSDVCKSGTCTGTTPVVCQGATGCRDAGTCNPATGLCQSGTSKPNGTTCDDNNLCTNGDVCQSGQCTGAPVVCVGDQCHDAGTCDPASGICFNPNKVNGTACSDAVKCTAGDVCTDGACAGDAVVCAAQDSCHVAGTCVEETGLCTNPVAPDGQSCTDGNACTQTDSCATGVCRGSNPVLCPGESACRNAALCDGGSGLCLNATPKPEGTTCSDAKNCTTADACRAGECQGAPVVCSAQDACHVPGVCNEADGLCSNPVAPDGTTCSDGRACTTSDRCSAGTCGGAPVVCPAPADACHVQGTCDEASGQCTTPAAPDGTVCNDGLRCTVNDQCVSGSCGGGPVVCPAPSDACHLRGTCNESSGTCSTPVAPDGTSCSDGNLCTRTDACTSGICAGSNPVVCAAGDQCNNGGACNPGTGTCSARQPKPAGTQCDDGIRCTTGDSCTAGTCGGSPRVCAAGQTCREASGTCDTLNACESCVQQHIASGECPTQLGCANITTGAADTALCVALRDCMLSTACWSNDPLDCLCGSAMGTDCLTAPTGACRAEVIAAAKTSDPAQVATLFYDFSVPAGFATQELGCIKDYCSPGSNPPSTACPVAVCPDDGNPCTREVVVNGVCTHPPAADGASCSDSNACTQVDTCQDGACMPGPTVQCAGGSACTEAGTCDPGSGLCVGGVAKPDGTTCDDGRRCTSNDRCSAGTCGGSAVVCPAPTDACHVQGTCQEETGTCSNPAAPEGTSCSDGNACTQVDSCQNGACMPGPAVQCGGASACTEAGTCDPSSGVCVGGAAKPDGTTCSDGRNCTTADACSGGTCTGAPVTCPAAGVCQVPGTCQEATGTCGPATAAPNGSTCNDGRNCTTADVCSAGVCGGTAVTCNGPESCDEGDGICKLDACWTCKQDAINNGLCIPETGCHLIANAADRALCVALRDCMLNTHCAVQDPFNCFCGQFQGPACLSNADGACKQAVLDATRAGTSLTDAGTRFYDTAFPAGFATQEIACAKDYCASFPAAPTDACTL